jgi:hypothetical protein
MNLLREALDVHRTGTVDERRRWVLRHPTFSSFAVCLVVTVGVTVTGLLLRPDAVTVPAFVAMFGATFAMGQLLLLLAGRAGGADRRS